LTKKQRLYDTFFQLQLMMHDYRMNFTGSCRFEACATEKTSNDNKAILGLFYYLVIFKNIYFMCI